MLHNDIYWQFYSKNSVPSAHSSLDDVFVLFSFPFLNLEQCWMQLTHPPCRTIAKLGVTGPHYSALVANYWKCFSCSSFLHFLCTSWFCILHYYCVLKYQTTAANYSLCLLWTEESLQSKNLNFEFLMNGDSQFAVEWLTLAPTAFLNFVSTFS